MTKLIINRCTSPSFNLALEEYLLKNFKDSDVVVLWQNSPSVIIGRNQNAYAEIDTEFVNEHNIPVIRRLTGGGAVFHDLGNINYTLITDYNEGGLDSFAHFAQPVCAFLASYGLDASFSGRNDITVNGKKISGTAKTVLDGRTLAHGTLLYSADLSYLEKALKPNIEKLKDKAVKSVKSRVVNISSLLSEALSVDDFFDGLAKFILDNDNVELCNLKKEDIYNVRQIEKQRYARFEWNFGSSPSFQYHNQKKFDYGIVECYVDVKQGEIEKIKFFGDFFSDREISELENALLGTKLQKSDLDAALSDVLVNEYISFASASDIVSLVLSL